MWKRMIYLPVQQFCVSIILYNVPNSVVFLTRLLID